MKLRELINHLKRVETVTGGEVETYFEVCDENGENSKKYEIEDVTFHRLHNNPDENFIARLSSTLY